MPLRAWRLPFSPKTGSSPKAGSFKDKFWKPGTVQASAKDSARVVTAKVTATMSAMAEKMLGIEELRAISLEAATGASTEEFCERLQSRLGLEVDASELELRRTTASGWPMR